MMIISSKITEDLQKETIYRAVSFPFDLSCILTLKLNSNIILTL